MRDHPLFNSIEKNCPGCGAQIEQFLGETLGSAVVFYKCFTRLSISGTDKNEILKDFIFTCPVKTSKIDS